MWSTHSVASAMTWNVTTSVPKPKPSKASDTTTSHNT